MINNIKNGQKSNKSFVINQKNNLSVSLLNILWKEGFILGYTVEEKNKLKIFLKYKNSNSVLKYIKVLSKPSNKIYFSSNKLWKLVLCMALSCMPWNISIFFKSGFFCWENFMACFIIPVVEMEGPLSKTDRPIKIESASWKLVDFLLCLNFFFACG